jgi:hypothetical protein
MRLELVVLLITAFFAYNAYHDGKYTSLIYKNKKNLQIAGYVFAGLSLYLVLRKDPTKGKQLLLHANNTIKYLPIEKHSADLLSPIIDFTVGDSASRSFMGALNPTRSSAPNMEQKILQSGKLGGGYGGAGYDRSTKTKATKRSVSETKKKYVASMQDWRCGDCRDKLNAWFEVDHKVRLEYGGGNDVGNLIAMCRNCHGKKTAFENM